MTECTNDPGSFRDPTGSIFYKDGKVFRTIVEGAGANYESVRDRDILKHFEQKGYLIRSEERPVEEFGQQGGYVLEHPMLDYISYPYEWSFSLLKAAALFHLDFHLELFERDADLVDATAYNIQFQGTTPVFIDVLSVQPYMEGSYWFGHNQFCEQFLNPLLLQSFFGICHNQWYRGGLEGVPTADLHSLLPFHKKLSWNVFTHVVAKNSLQSRSASAQTDDNKKVMQRKLPRAAYKGMLLQLRNWIARLTPKNKVTVWGEYENSHSYSDNTLSLKKEFVAEFVKASKPGLVFDLGCNTGEFSELALDSGAGRVVGFDCDQVALEKAYVRSRNKGLNFLPLYFDAANPSPNQGWRQLERKGFVERSKADAIIVLAFEHHLAIGRNVPLEQLVDWLLGLAPRGVIEFVEKDDPMIQQMLSQRKDIFPHYSAENFEACLTTTARIVKKSRIAQTHRIMYWFERMEK